MGKCCRRVELHPEVEHGSLGPKTGVFFEKMFFLCQGDIFRFHVKNFGSVSEIDIPWFQSLSRSNFAHRRFWRKTKGTPNMKSIFHSPSGVAEDFGKMRRILFVLPKDYGWMKKYCLAPLQIQKIFRVFVKCNLELGVCFKALRRCFKVLLEQIGHCLIVHSLTATVKGIV